MRRDANEQRRLRIMDARARTMGLDIEALNAQVEEKNRTKRAGQDSEELLSNNIRIKKFRWILPII